MSITFDDTALDRAFDVRGRSLWVDARRRLLANKAAVASMIVLVVIALAAILAPLLSPYAYDSIDYSVISCAPDWWPGDAIACRAGGAHWFGTDAVGRDLFIRVLYGARVSLAVGIVATLVSLLIGVGYGAIAGFAGRRLDGLMMRFVDVLYSLPYIFLVIVLMVIFNRNFYLTFVAIGAVEWLTMARIVRGQTLSIRHKEFIEAARAAGVGRFATIGRHVIPNVVSPVVVYMSLTIPNVILAESFVSFLGLGIQEPLTSWGVLISQGADQMEAAPWMLIFPSLFMAATLFAFNFIGDGLRDALDPKDR
ncbi:MAG TPA: ABC transporter permease subunit [Rhizomicrobium sp.]|jgi:oligopeptide transport system permease protein|nr:ABC transporter permease subunit [Rhizomicrobium sp.]